MYIASIYTINIHVHSTRIHNQYTCVVPMHTINIHVYRTHMTLRHNVNIRILNWNNSFRVWCCTHLHIHLYMGWAFICTVYISYFLPRFRSVQNNQISKDPGQRMCKCFFLLLLTKKIHVWILLKTVFAYR